MSCRSPVCLLQAYGVVGCVQFLEAHYLLLITKRTYQGSLCGHKVYSISDTALVPLVQPSAQVHCQVPLALPQKCPQPLVAGRIAAPGCVLN